MSVAGNTFEQVKAVILSVHEGSTPQDKINFYNSWAENYDQDVAVLDYRAPSLAANAVSSHFSGDREAAVVLDVACGTGLVAKQLKTHGFGRFLGVDGSEAMLERARETGLYQDLKQCILGQEMLPFQQDFFDVVMMVGGLSFGHAPVGVVREMCKAAKSGGYVCFTTRANVDNVAYKSALDGEVKQMEEDEGLWTCVAIHEVKEWERAVTEHEEGYVSGCVYVCKRL